MISGTSTWSSLLDAPDIKTGTTRRPVDGHLSARPLRKTVANIIFSARTPLTVRFCCQAKVRDFLSVSREVTRSNPAAIAKTVSLGTFHLLSESRSGGKRQLLGAERADVSPGLRRLPASNPHHTIEVVGQCVVRYDRGPSVIAQMSSATTSSRVRGVPQQPVPSNHAQQVIQTFRFHLDIPLAGVAHEHTNRTGFYQSRK